jgi:hypothetical protein
MLGVLSGNVLSADEKTFGSLRGRARPAGRPRGSLRQSNAYRTADADQNGHYEFKNLIPGEYRAYAVSRLEGFHFWDPPSMKPFEASSRLFESKRDVRMPGNSRSFER